VATATTPAYQAFIIQGQRLDYFTIAYNSAEALVSIIAGFRVPDRLRLEQHPGRRYCGG